MADQNAWMRAGEPPLTPPDEDGRRCTQCDAVLQGDRDGEERCVTPGCGYSLDVDAWTHKQKENYG